MATPSQPHNNLSTGQKMVEAGWLDVHYLASKPQYEAMLAAAGLQAGWQVLDAGCGNGCYIPMMSELLGADGAVTAVDLAPENITAIQRRLASNPPACPVDVIAASVAQLPFDDHCFDAIWCANTVQYFLADALAPLLAEFKRVLKPAGRLVIKEFDDVGVHFGPFDPVLKWHLFEQLKGKELLLGAGALFVVELRSFLLDAGFQDVKLQTFSGDFQHPLSETEREFLHSALGLYYSLAQQANLPAGELAQWQAAMGDDNSPDYLLNRRDFYFREVHGLATATATP